MTEVKTIREENGAALVEWMEDGKVKRSILPSSEISSEGFVEDPEAGLTYGFPFADYIKVKVSPEDIQQSLHYAGVWTAEDLLSKPGQAQSAIVAAYGAVLQDLLASVTNYLQKETV